MLLPALKSLRDCSDFSLSVEPFIPQLYTLPQRLIQVKTFDGFTQLYTETNPLVFGFALSIFLGCVFLLVSEVNKNYSQVDRLWSILPNVYVIHLAVWARLAGLPHSRIDLVAAFTTAWSCRLTFNYWRRGGYSVGSEDYRWKIVQSNMSDVAFYLLNVIFISFFQSVVLFAFSSLPAYAILLSSQFEPEVTTADLAFFIVELALVLSEFFSDGQQWTYQTAKRQYNKDAKLPMGWKQVDLDRGFVTSGPWAYSRHPNFVAEQTIWFVLYQWSCYATDSLYSWTFIGSGALMLIFQGSTLLTEAITAGKYPEYKEYQKQIGMFIPTSLRGYKAPADMPPKIIRTSDLSRRQQEKEKKKQK